MPATPPLRALSQTPPLGSSSNSGGAIDRLPVELRQAIYARLERDDFVCLSQTSRSWRHASTSVYSLRQQLERRGLTLRDNASAQGLIACKDPRVLRQQLIADHPYHKPPRRCLQMAGLGFIHDVALSVRHQLLVASDSSRAHLCDLTQLQSPSKAFDGLFGGVHHVCFAPDGQAATLVTAVGQLFAWDLAEKRTRLGSEESIWAPAVTSSTSNGRSMLLGRADGRVLGYGAHAFRMDWQAHKAAVTAVGCVAQSDTWATADALGCVKLWRAQSAPSELGCATGHAGPIRSVCISSDARWVATGADDATACLWRYHNGALTLAKRIKHHSPVHTVCVSDNAMMWASASEDAVVRVGYVHQPDAAPITLQGHTDFINSVRFLRNGRFVLTSSQDGTARLWDVSQTPATHSIVDGRASPLSCTAVSFDGRFVATGGEDGAVKVFAYALDDNARRQQKGAFHSV